MPSIQYYNSVVGEQVKVIGQNVGIGTSTPSAKLNVENGNLVFNDLGGNFDFRVEGDTDANLLFTDASTDRVGIGTNMPLDKIMIQPTNATTDLVGASLMRNSTWGSSYTNKYLSYAWRDASNIVAAIGARYDGSSVNIDFHSMYNGAHKTSADVVMSIHGDGNVGIGTATPQAKLDVNGDITITDKIIHEGDTNTFIRFGAADTFSITTAGTSRIHCDASGRIGILNNQPVVTLDVAGPIAARSLITEHQTNAAIFDFAGGAARIRAYGATAGAGFIDFRTGGGGDSADAQAMRIDAQQNVGIGTISPSSRLQVEGGNVVFNDNGGNYDFRVEGDTDQNLLFVDASTDRVGISTAVPDVKLQVNESAAHDNNYVYDTNGLMIVHPTPTSNTTLNDPKEILYIVREGTSAQAFGAAASFSLSRYENSLTYSRTRLDIDLAHGAFLGSKTNVMTMRSDGNVGIGTSTPAYKLDVNGTFSANSINVNDQFTFPTVDGSSGQALVTNGSGVVSWGDIASANLTRGSFEVTSTQSTFTVSGGYTLNTLSVYYNGVKLLLGTDFTATNGTTFTLTNSAVNGDIVEYWALNSASSAVGNTSTGSVSVTSNQTVFNVTNGYTVGGLVVFVNGVKLVDGVDFTATNGSSFTLTSAATSGDVVDYIAYGAVVASSNLQKTGDSMTGNLTVNADLLIGSGNSLTIGQGGSDSFTFPTGDGSANQIIETDGSGNLSWVNKPQVVTNVYTGKTTYSVATAGNLGTYIAVLNTSITPTKSSSKIRVELNITFEITHNTIFRLFRSINGGADTEVVRNDDGNYWSGWAIPGYDANDTSTPRTNHHIYIDSPNTTLPITYKFMIQSAGDPASTFYLNRSIGYAGSSQAENGISQVILTEIPQ